MDSARCRPSIRNTKQAPILRMCHRFDVFPIFFDDFLILFWVIADFLMFQRSSLYLHPDAFYFSGMNGAMKKFRSTQTSFKVEDKSTMLRFCRWPLYRKECINSQKLCSMERVDQVNSILWRGDIKAFGRKARGLDFGPGHGRPWLWFFGQLECAKPDLGGLL